MAVVNTKSTAITNRDATPYVINDTRIERAVLKSGIGSVAVANGDSATSYYPLVQVPTTAMVRGVLLNTTAITSAAGNIGVFKTTVNSAGVTTGVAANTGSNTFFASAQSLASALSRSDVTGASGTYTTDKREQPLWQAIGLASDPGGFFDIGIVLTAASTAAGRAGLEVQYSDQGS